MSRDYKHVTHFTSRDPNTHAFGAHTVNTSWTPIMNTSSNPETPRKSEKRAPSTPLVPSKHQNKKSSTSKLDKPMPKSLVMEVGSTSKHADGLQLLHSRLQFSILEKRWKEQKDLSDFLQLERGFAEV